MQSGSENTRQPGRGSGDCGHQPQKTVRQNRGVGGPMNKEHFQLVGEAVKAEPYHYRGCGLDGIYLLNGYHPEEHDGELHVSVTDMEGLHRAIGRHLVMHRKVLAPKEIRFLRKTMDLTQTELAQRLGNNSQTVARWEKGEFQMPGPEEKLLRAIFLASLLPEKELATLRDLLANQLAELDELDQFDSPRAQFQLFGEWREEEVAYA